MTGLVVVERIDPPFTLWVEHHRAGRWLGSTPYTGRGAVLTYLVLPPRDYSPVMGLYWPLPTQECSS